MNRSTRPPLSGSPVFPGVASGQREFSVRIWCGSAGIPRMQREIWLAETWGAAIKAFDHFLEKCGAKDEAACTCLSTDRDAAERHA